MDVTYWLFMYSFFFKVVTFGHHIFLDASPRDQILISPCLTSLYTYDMRKLEKPVTVHMDHISAVLDVDYSPTGEEFVSASFDKTIRIFPKNSGRSRLVIISPNYFYSHTHRYI